MILPYIINVAVILLACLAFYKLLLRRETFYKVNRFFLIACLAISFALPLLQVPEQFSFRKSVNRESLIVNSEPGRQTSNVKSETVKNDQPKTINEQPLTNNSTSPTSNQPQTSNFKPQTFLSSPYGTASRLQEGKRKA